MTRYILLMPSEEEVIMRPIPAIDKSANAETLRMVQSKVERAGSTSPELELTEAEMQRVRRARNNWKGGYERQMQAILEAASRH